MADEKRTSTTIIRTRPPLKAAAERVGKDQDRSMSALIEKSLTDHLREAGYLPPTDMALKEDGGAGCRR